jgi:hypothetical protein
MKLIKQTTIQIYIEEAIFGATVFATSSRTGWTHYGTGRNLPLPEEEQAWRLIAGENAQWGVGKIIEPKAEDDEEWLQKLSERIQRVCSKRKFKTKVKPLETCSKGYATRWAVTFYWSKPLPPPIFDTPGIWKLREYKGTSRKCRIIKEIKASLECSGDDLYCHLPDGDVPEGYDAYPDYNSVAVMPTTEEAMKKTTCWWEFRFKAKRKKNTQ